jgi:glycosyltransferase involved in cell wall biosynthesis
MKERFFSIIIPAHNEENYISKAIEAIKNINYPKDNLEVIIVENGSNDKTCEIVKSKITETFKFITIKERGVSKAKNMGIDNLSNKSNWVIFLDADTILLTDFLKNLNNYFELHKDENLSVGTTYVLPLSDLKYARIWFKFYNWGHRFTKSSFSIQIAKTPFLKNVRFDEDLTFEEDYKFLNELKKYGEYFFFNTESVLTSTRRFDKYGWFKLFFIWLSYVITPSYFKRKIQYKGVR